MTETKKKSEVKTTEPEVVKTPKVVESSPAEKKEIRVIERIIENREIAPQDAFGKLTKNQVALIKNTIAKGASDDELRLFIQVCKGAQLNPFLKQVHLVPRWDSKTGREVRAIQVSIDGFRSIAESSGAYAGNEDPIFDGEQEIEYGKEKRKITIPNSAKVTVYKIVDGQRYPFTATARWTEYYPGEKMGFQWHIRPYLMLGKCAEALALRKAFPTLLSGMYAQEEMNRGSEQESDSKKIQTSFQKLMDVIQQCTAAELKDYEEKMSKSDKYTPDQKVEFAQAVSGRKESLGLNKQLVNDGDVAKEETPEK